MKYIRIPEFEKLKNKHVRVIVLSEETGNDEILILTLRHARENWLVQLCYSNE